MSNAKTTLNMCNKEHLPDDDFPANNLKKKDNRHIYIQVQNALATNSLFEFMNIVVPLAGCDTLVLLGVIFIFVSVSMPDGLSH